ncbi:MAG: nicotinate-nucleotide--dimethylbenzimidazole phosphoribosyltransferase [Bacteroidales bacterium]|nr:nicotinate-nucleotide--dimethylbenzimidazole phosphoribosyltransferase [Bacteroidales bacterium]
MKAFNIRRPNEALRPAIQDKINNLTKPKGSLGMLESLAEQICMVQQTLTPTLNHPQNLLFAADHGIEREGVSLSPRDVTWQQTCHFLQGGAGISFLCKQHGFTLKVIDAGVDHDLPYETGIINKSIRRGTRNFRYESAMTLDETDLCFQHGADMVDMCIEEGSNILSFGEMGIGNTTPSSIWMHMMTDIELEKCIGAGSGLNTAGIRHKYEVIKDSISHYSGDKSPLDIITWFGGFEMNMAVGAMLRAAERQIVFIVDGFIMSSCVLAASKLYPEVLSYAIFGHQGDESGHKLLLEALHAHPILHLNLRLGEGSGAVCAYPIIESAVLMINEMASFKKAEVTKYF